MNRCLLRVFKMFIGISLLLATTGCSESPERRADRITKECAATVDAAWRAQNITPAEYEEEKSKFRDYWNKDVSKCITARGDAK
jgi:hypothetical protein